MFSKLDQTFTHFTAKTFTGRRYWRAAVVMPGSDRYTYFQIVKLAHRLYAYSAQTDGKHCQGYSITRREAIERLTDAAFRFTPINA